MAFDGCKSGGSGIKVFMQKGLGQKLVERWPGWTDVNGDIRKTLMPFGFAQGNGWFDLVWHLCGHLEPVYISFVNGGRDALRVLYARQLCPIGLSQ